MKTIAFFAAPQELSKWIDEWRQRFGLQLGVVTFTPRFELVILVEGEHLASLWSTRDERAKARLEEVWLSVDPLNATGVTAAQVRSDNRDCLIIDPPKLSASTLMEGSIGTVSRNPERLKIWNKIASDLKKQKIKPGMWVFNREMQTKAFYKDEFYSSGAAELVKGGGGLTTPTGLEVFIDEPQITRQSTTTKKLSENSSDS